MGIAPESWPEPFRSLIRTSNKYVVNPVMMRMAGRRSWYASVIKHTGRRSGRQYSTPIVVDRVGDDVYIPLPYGTDVDWLRNVCEAGSAEIVSKGTTYRVVSPEVVTAAVALPALPAARRRTFDRVSIGHFLHGRASN